MSVLLSLIFALIGGLAIAAMIASWRRYAPLALNLRRRLGSLDAATELRFALREHGLIRLRPNRGPLRHRHRPKPVTHRLNGPKPRRAAA